MLRKPTVKLINLFVLSAFLLICFAGCGSGSNQERFLPDTFIPEEWAGRQIGVITGSIHDQVIAEFIPGSVPAYFNDTPSAIIAMKNGQIDGVLMDEDELIIMGPSNPGLFILEPYFDPGDAGILVSKDKPELLEKMNQFIAQIKSDGTYDEMLGRWIGGDEIMPNIPEGTGELLRLGTAGATDGFSFYKDGELVGFDLEFARRFAAYADMRLEITVMDIGGLIAAVQIGRIDFAANCFAITEERKELANYTDPYYTSARAIGVYDPALDTTVLEPASFWQNLETAIRRNLIQEDRWKMLVDGLKVSVAITLLAFAFATVLGFCVCGLRMNKNPILRAIGSLYITVLRGTPIVVLLMITFYVIFAKSSVSGIVIAVVAFGANSAAFIGETIRSAIGTIDKGQIEAARSMGFSKAGAFINITLPQSVRVALPVYIAEFVSLFKMTSVVGYIAIVDLTKAGDIIRSRTYDAFFPLIVVALIYLLSAAIIVYIFNWVSRITDKRLRRASK